MKGVGFRFGRLESLLDNIRSDFGYRLFSFYSR